MGVCGDVLPLTKLLCTLSVQLKSVQLNIIESLGDLPGQLVILGVHHSLNAISVSRL